MKKTLITLLVMAGVAGATTAIPVWTQENITLSNDTVYDLSSFGLNTTTGYTLMMEVNLTAPAVNGPLCYVTNAEVELSSESTVNAYSSSTGSVGFGNQNNGMITFSKSGSYNGGTAGSSDVTNAISYIYDESQAYSTTLFLTSIGGTTELYELTSTGDVIKTHYRSDMGTGDIEQLIVGDWWAGTNGVQNQQEGTMNVAMYSGVLTQTQMNSLMVPEPATATLSLLALTGLAMRRRRK